MSERCGATIETRAYDGAPSVLSRRYCRAWAMKSYDRCRHHIRAADQERYNAEFMDRLRARWLDKQLAGDSP